MRFRSIVLFVTAILMMSACGSRGQASTVAPVPLTDTPIPLPTLSPTPTVPLAVLIVPATLDLDTSNLYQKTVYDLAQQSGLRFQVRNDFTEADLTNSVFDNCDLAGAKFEKTILEKADLRTSHNYSIDPEINKIKKAKFSVHGITGLLDKYDIEIE